MWGMARGPYEMSPGRIMPLVSTYILNINTVTQLPRTPRTLNTLTSTCILLKRVCRVLFAYPVCNWRSSSLEGSGPGRIRSAWGQGDVGYRIEGFRTGCRKTEVSMCRIEGVFLPPIPLASNFVFEC